MTKVVIAIPLYRFPLQPEEQISIRHLRHFLGDQEQVVVAPEGLEIADDYLRSLPVERFRPAYFADIPGYNRLMLSEEFYARFGGYEHLLIHQLDCLVFSSDLAAWCEQGWDYIGAPWFKGFRGDTSEGFWAAGNGGLSLRHLSSFLEVIRSRQPGVLQVAIGETRFHRSLPWLDRALRGAKSGLYRMGYKNNFRYVAQHYHLHEDSFWAFEASRFVPEFRVAPPEQAVGFAFEYAPRFCSEANGGKLPFGCHAWAKTDRAFWEPFLLPS